MTIAAPLRIQKSRDIRVLPFPTNPPSHLEPRIVTKSCMQKHPENGETQRIGIDSGMYLSVLQIEAELIRATWEYLTSKAE